MQRPSFLLLAAAAVALPLFTSCSKRDVEASAPKTSDAPTALYRRGRILWDADKKAEARQIFNRLLADYPRSDEAPLAKSLITP